MKLKEQWGEQNNFEKVLLVFIFLMEIGFLIYLIYLIFISFYP
jgi:hypothetical protein